MTKRKAPTSSWPRRLMLPFVLLGAISLVLTVCIGATGASGTSGTAPKLNTSNPFRIASPWDGTGADAAVGAEWRAALSAAVTHINQHGGILGRKVVVTYEDTQSSPVRVFADNHKHGRQRTVPGSHCHLGRPYLLGYRCGSRTGWNPWRVSNARHSR